MELTLKNLATAQEGRYKVTSRDMVSEVINLTPKWLSPDTRTNTVWSNGQAYTPEAYLEEKQSNRKMLNGLLSQSPSMRLRVDDVLYMTKL